MHLDAGARAEEREVFDLLRQSMLQVEHFVCWELRAAGFAERESRRAAMHFLALWQGAGMRALAGGTEDDTGRLLRDWFDSVLGDAAYR